MGVVLGAVSVGRLRPMTGFYGHYFNKDILPKRVGAWLGESGGGETKVKKATVSC
jgi:hypothetical protein